ncbi:MAG TPA: CPBP family intramembrane glutamic endopeptidase [Candidatus Lokiarchaeia archaeon]|nr:CPBP family intramembrane glutamic endopeptidase [Candidatus Lokiarchaeia archaeon]
MSEDASTTRKSFDLRAALRFRSTTDVNPQGKHTANVILGTTVICLLVYLFLGYPDFYYMVFKVPHFVLTGLNSTQAEYWYVKIYYNWGMATLLFFVVPYLVARKLGIGVRDCGVKVGNWKIGLPLMVLGLVLVPVFAQSYLTDPQALANYPLLRPFADWNQFGYPSFNGGLWFLGEFSYVVIYYIPYEYFWRGFAQIPLRKHGKINTFWIVLWTTCLTTIVHLPVPLLELEGAVLLGIIIGWLALKTDSIIYGLVFHAAVGLGTDFLSTAVVNGWTTI